MIEPTPSDEVWGVWNRLREYMRDTYRYELLEIAERKNKLACAYLNVTTEKDKEFMGRYLRNSLIKKTFHECYENDLERNKDWLRNAQATENGIVFGQPAKTFCSPKKSDNELLDEIVNQFRHLYASRKKKGLIK